MHDSPHVAPQQERMARLCFVKLPIMSVEFILCFLLPEKKIEHTRFVNRMCVCVCIFHEKNSRLCKRPFTIRAGRVSGLHVNVRFRFPVVVSTTVSLGKLRKCTSRI